VAHPSNEAHPSPQYPLLLGIGFAVIKTKLQVPFDVTRIQDWNRGCFRQRGFKPRLGPTIQLGKGHGKTNLVAAGILLSMNLVFLNVPQLLVVVDWDSVEARIRARSKSVEAHLELMGPRNQA
jgi:hypothetical protein